MDFKGGLGPWLDSVPSHHFNCHSVLIINSIQFPCVRNDSLKVDAVILEEVLKTLPRVHTFNKNLFLVIRDACLLFGAGVVPASSSSC